MNANTPLTWQEFLRQLIADPKRKRALAGAIHVRTVTLQRWVEGISIPREENIRLLLKKVPAETYPLLMRLLVQSFPELLQDILQEEHQCRNIPSGFYARAMSNLALTPQPIYRLSMQDLLLQQQLEQIDPDRRGVAITIAVCVPPRPYKKVRSLFEIGGLGTTPWPSDLATKPMFLGDESLAGYAVKRMRPFIINSRDEMTFCPAHWTEFERSAAAFPILLHGQVVGSLIVSSTREFFFTDTLLSIIEEYSQLVSCVFEPEEAYPAEDIELRVMPSQNQQLPYFRQYSQRIAYKFSEMSAEKKQVTVQHVRQFVWQDIEESLIQAFSGSAGGKVALADP